VTIRPIASVVFSTIATNVRWTDRRRDAQLDEIAVSVLYSSLWNVRTQNQIPNFCKLN